MEGYSGNKTLLPLISRASLFQGERMILIEALENLPPGEKAVVVNYKKEDVIAATRLFNATYCDQPITNGTGGALIAATDFLKKTRHDKVIVTMGDVPLIKKSTYRRLLSALANNAMVVLGFKPKDKAQYGALELMGDRALRITEWKYWKDYPSARQAELTVFNTGVYAYKTSTLLHYIDLLKDKPHIVEKVSDGKKIIIEEFFITDLIEMMADDGLNVGFILVDDEIEAMGVDTPSALKIVQSHFQQSREKLPCQ